MITSLFLRKGMITLYNNDKFFRKGTAFSILIFCECYCSSYQVATTLLPLLNQIFDLWNMC